MGTFLGSRTGMLVFLGLVAGALTFFALRGSGAVENENAENQEDLVSLVDASLAPIAFRDANGNVWLSPPTATVGKKMQLLDIATGDASNVAVPVEDRHFITLLDVGTVNGQITVLYKTTRDRCAGAPDMECVSELRAFTPASGQHVVLAQTGAWEAGWGSFQLGETGVVFGSQYGNVWSSPVVFRLGDVKVPDLAGLGLEQNYGDCPECPRLFTVDSAGKHVAWLTGSGGSAKLTIVPIDGATVGSPLEIAVDLPEGSAFTRLEIGAIQGDNTGGVQGTALFTPWRSGNTDPVDPPVQALQVNLHTGEVIALDSSLVASVD